MMREAGGWLDRPGTPVVLLFGGNVQKRDEVVRLLGPALTTTVIGTLSEEEGAAAIEQLGAQVGVVLIGGRYGEAQRLRVGGAHARGRPRL